MNVEWRDCTRCGGFDQRARHRIHSRDLHHYECCDQRCTALRVSELLAGSEGSYIGLAGSG